ncbi:MAG: TraB/GumN family protein [Thermodesulfobacteriota bacterium]
MGNNNEAIHRLGGDDTEIILVGTAHVSRESADLVSDVIKTEAPDTVCLELCESRYQAIRQKERWREMDIIKVIKEKKAFLLLSNLLLASFQKKIANQFGIMPGQEMLNAIEAAEAAGADIYLADRDIRITLSRVWRSMGWWQKIKLLYQLILSTGELDEISEADIEKMKQQDVLEALLLELEASLPVLRKILIDERDRFLAHKIKAAPGRKKVAVVGAGHVPGIKRYWGDSTDVNSLEKLPPKSKAAEFIKWFIPLGIGALMIFGFYIGGAGAGTQMLKWWVLVNGLLAGLGAVLALAHPLTILSAMVAAPITSLNPMIAAGWVSGLVEAVSRKPKVKDFESLSEDILSFKGFWRNKVTRVLLVVVFTNLGSSIGTFVAIPLMAKVF